MFCARKELQPILVDLEDPQPISPVQIGQWEGKEQGAHPHPAMRSPVQIGKWEGQEQRARPHPATRSPVQIGKWEGKEPRARPHPAARDAVQTRPVDVKSNEPKSACSAAGHGVV